MKTVIVCIISAGFALLTGNIEGRSPSDGKSKALSLRGKVQSVEIKEIDRSSALIEIKLRMEFVNSGVRPIIFLRREPLFPGGALAKTPTDFAVGKVLAGDAGWPANDISPEWANLREKLDKPSPPADETRLLMPGESWSVETSIKLVVPTDPSRYISSRKKETLATIRQLSPVWLRVVCEVWPWNVEPLTPDRNRLKFGRKLQQRWKDVGLLWLDDIYSDPMTLDLNSNESSIRGQASEMVASIDADSAIAISSLRGVRGKSQEPQVDQL